MNIVSLIIGCLAVLLVMALGIVFYIAVKDFKKNVNVIDEGEHELETKLNKLKQDIYKITKEVNFISNQLTSVDILHGRRNDLLDDKIDKVKSECDEIRALIDTNKNSIDDIFNDLDQLDDIVYDNRDNVEKLKNVDEDIKDDIENIQWHEDDGYYAVEVK